MLFAQVREDPLVELSVVNKLESNSKVLCVTSGGCTVMSILCDKIHQLDAIDMNNSQNYLCELKVGVCKYFNNLQDILNFYQGEMTVTKNLVILNQINISENCRKYWLDNINNVCSGINRTGKFEELFRYLVANDFDYNKVFNREYLSIIFGEDAVKNSKDKEFYDHFSNVVEIYKQKYDPKDNYFYYQILHDSYPENNFPYYLTNLDNLKYSDRINYVVGNYFDYISNVTDNYYNMIHTSNLTDWLDNNKLDMFVKNLHRILNNNGYLVMRRLNGDYKLKDIVSNYFEILDTPIDKSHFYSEVVVCKKVDKSEYN
jgi:S-adenosylmethionine:diacylglycerol 3-amino-3-carboxypropyl transferase